MDAVTAARGHIYSFFCGVLAPLPSAALLTQLAQDENSAFLDMLRSLNQAELTAGADEFSAYLQALTPENLSDRVAELAIDRTALLRTAAGAGNKAPYERLFRPKSEEESVIPAVHAFYRRAGLRQPNAAQESPDYLLTQLEFLSNLCLQQDTLPQSTQLCREFFTQHAGAWIPAWAAQAGKAAQTGFYRGVLRMLTGFLHLEAEFLQ
jgi:TorA maturation chaperone TorD